jgi:hypothetical protein
MLLGRFFLGLAFSPFASEELRISLIPEVLWRGVIYQAQSIAHLLSVILISPVTYYFSKLLNSQTKTLQAIIIYVLGGLAILTFRWVIFGVAYQRFDNVDVSAIFFAVTAIAVWKFATYFVQKLSGDAE